LSVDFHPALSEPTPQYAQRQIMLAAKSLRRSLLVSNSVDQPFDLLAASPLANANPSDFRHSDSASKNTPVRGLL
jgi:hypothetical protein